MWDVDTIYKVPQMLHDQGLDDIICEALRLEAPPADLAMWTELVDRLENPKHEVTIGMVGKYVDLIESYKSLTEALRHAGIHTDDDASTSSTSTPKQIESTGCADLAKYRRHPGAGRLRQARRGRQDHGGPLRPRKQDPLPRHLPGHAGGADRIRAPRGRPAERQLAPSSIRDTDQPVVALITEWQDRDGKVEKRDVKSDLGGTMRLGAQTCAVKPGTLAAGSTATS